MIESPVPTRTALLVWQRPLDQSGRRDRHPVAKLVQESDQVSFQYLGNDELCGAYGAGFNGYPGLPLESDNLSRIASDVLMRRLPPRDRADFSEVLARFGLPADYSYSDLSLLAYTGARLTSDSFSVCETFDGFEGSFSYVFDVAGVRHSDLNGLEVGEPISFEPEPTNPYDPDAIRLLRRDGRKVGYVNRIQAPKVLLWLENGSLTASVFRVNGRLEYPRLFVRADIETNARASAA